MAYIWIAASLLGTALAILTGVRAGRRVHSPFVNATAKRAATFWLLLVFYGIAAIAVAGVASDDRD